jgi:hypothetical protein
MANPQRLNRYAYVLNAPVNFLDPDGAEPIWAYWLIEGVRNPLWDYLWNAYVAPNLTRAGPAGAGGSSGRGGGPSLLTQEGSSARFQFIGQASLQSLARNIRWEDPDCAKIFSTLGVGKEEYLAKLGSVQLVDGTTSQLLIEDLVNEYYARAAGVLGWTVARLFKDNFPGKPPNTYINAWSPPTRPYIFLYGQGFPGSPLKPYSGVNPATIAHEVFHKLHNPQDEHLLRGEWGLDPSGSSQRFLDYFRSKCL